jgi:hypothetical protein
VAIRGQVRADAAGGASDQHRSAGQGKALGEVAIHQYTSAAMQMTHRVNWLVQRCDMAPLTAPQAALVISLWAVE